MPMRFERIEVTAQDGSGIKKVAEKLLCEDCARDKTCAADTFVVFRIEGQSHFHLQCADCGTSYCPGGECSPEIN